MAETERTVGQVRRTRIRTSSQNRMDHRRNGRPPHAQVCEHPTRTRPPGRDMNQPCLDCGRPANGTRCERHQASHTRHANRIQNLQRKANGGRPQYAGEWKRISRGVRLTATLCWVCKKPATPDDPFQADHILPAATHGGGGPVAAAHRSCNITRSNKTRTQKQGGE